jgi:hypothetical protein
MTWLPADSPGPTGVELSTSEQLRAEVCTVTPVGGLSVPEKLGVVLP